MKNLFPRQPRKGPTNHLFFEEVGTVEDASFFLLHFDEVGCVFGKVDAFFAGGFLRFSSFGLGFVGSLAFGGLNILALGAMGEWVIRMS